MIRQLLKSRHNRKDKGLDLLGLCILEGSSSIPSKLYLCQVLSRNNTFRLSFLSHSRKVHGQS
jgi:hypothetical protein